MRYATYNSNVLVKEITANDLCINDMVIFVNIATGAVYGPFKAQYGFGFYFERPGESSVTVNEIKKQYGDCTLYRQIYSYEFVSDDGVPPYAREAWRSRTSSIALIAEPLPEDSD